ncbi:PD-(D/E)XK nuclease domain-containing protein [Methylobacterium marchantiae]|uniref:Uncharacterized protein n=1 Tax=Methylobacterium marchantiae TaxID=600331 RepID=A0ABW3X2E3_9HYPH
MASPAERSARHVAVLGYAAGSEHLDPTLLPVLREGLVWLAARPWNRPFRPPTLEVDGVSMLGVALGANSIGASTEVGGLGALAVASCASSGLSAFNRSLMAAAAHLLKAPGRPDLSTMLPEVRVALAELGIVPGDAGTHRDAWRNAMLHVAVEGGVAQTVLTLRAFNALCERNMPARLGRLEADDVVRVLQGVVRSFRHWTWEDRPRTRTSPTVRWDIEHEYHVQNLLWSVMAPLFPDLNAEEYTPPVGQKNPRMDLTVPSLRLVVEVKFVRPGARFADIIEEVAADASLYGADPKWEVLIPFIWDDSRRSEEHATLVEGLRKLEMVHDAVVVQRPGKMERMVPPVINGPVARRAGRRGPDTMPAGSARSGSCDHEPG